LELSLANLLSTERAEVRSSDITGVTTIKFFDQWCTFRSDLTEEDKAAIFDNVWGEVTNNKVTFFYLDANEDRVPLPDTCKPICFHQIIEQGHDLDWDTGDGEVDDTTRILKKTIARRGTGRTTPAESGG
jgi:hypothetical protein